MPEWRAVGRIAAKVVTHRILPPGGRRKEAGGSRGGALHLKTLLCPFENNFTGKRGEGRRPISEIGFVALHVHWYRFYMELFLDLF
jgi:hypothetical protein